MIPYSLMYCDICWQQPRKARTCETSEREDMFRMGQRLASFGCVPSQEIRDGVIVTDPVHAELRLARFNLDARPFAAAYECLEQLI
jgi:hypothetical protein